MCGARSWTSDHLDVPLLRSVYSQVLLPVWDQKLDAIPTAASHGTRTVIWCSKLSQP